MLPLAKRAAFVLALSLAVTPLHAADYTYQQTTQIDRRLAAAHDEVGGLYQFAGAPYGRPRRLQHLSQGQPPRQRSAESIEIIDLDKETITHIDVQKKTYTVMTFDQMKQAMANARAQMEKQQPAQPAAARHQPRTRKTSR